MTGRYHKDKCGKHSFILISLSVTSCLTTFTNCEGCYLESMCLLTGNSKICILAKLNLNHWFETNEWSLVALSHSEDEIS